MLYGTVSLHAPSPPIALPIARTCSPWDTSSRHSTMSFLSPSPQALLIVLAIYIGPWILLYLSGHIFPLQNICMNCA
ncbi:uncharacterized protein BDR25DRAFT_15845 [Lindgomyces ingoldianus]|uniref:Uncharacterized protein n=1 Tax=Lindgomyces ingoldianus TaxID=673940 RepID=A0ACB6QZX4_9PLEO|nr:uncharacterized protein BDR25DRAFT_15845 [Lindgomyces ingoldianus]KAF2472609.1 hypothetical protein BDR25DRAFT_15845 [Lindgomyces ingoldianus]